VIDKSAPGKEQALVIRTIRHGETSRIATLFAPKWGKIAVLAKGARSGKSGSVGGSLDVPSLIEAVVHIKSSRSVQLLGQTSTVESFGNVKSDVAKSAYSAVICEIILKGFTDEEPNALAFQSALHALRSLETGLVNSRFLLLDFLLSIADSLGFGVDPFTCPMCETSPGRTGLINRFILENGGFCCVNCDCTGLETHNVTGESVAILRLLKRGGVNLERVKVSKPAQNELIALLIHHLRYHHSQFIHLPSFAMLGQLTQDA